MLKQEDYPLLVIVDDEQEILTAIKRCLMRCDVNIESFTSPRLALEFLQEHEPIMVISDQRMPDILGMELLTSVKDIWPNTKRVMLSAFQEFDLVLEGFNEGIIDKFISKPWKNVELQYLVEGSISNLGSANKSSQLSKQFIGEHSLMQTMFDNISKAAGANVPIFIHGETGTGKELVANACHELGCKRAGKFVAVNCANFSEQLIESQLFGHKKGAFTGAVSDQKGVFEHADGGTVFLDEITTLPLNLQSKLLRVIQERTYSPVGSLEPREFDVQIVSASSTSLIEAVKLGEFRQDLYYRLSVIPIKIPSLKERGQDILSLAQHFLEKFSQQYQKRFTHFESTAEQFMLNYRWPGNVRQLENVVHGICVLNDDNQVQLSMIKSLIDEDDDLLIEQEQSYVAKQNNIGHSNATDSLNESINNGAANAVNSLHEVEKRAIEQALAHCGGNVNKAATLLEVNPSTLYRKIKGWSNI